VRFGVSCRRAGCEYPRAGSPAWGPPPGRAPSVGVTDAAGAQHAGASGAGVGPDEATIRRWLREDLDAPAKQRHTARRVWQRLIAEQGADVAESTVHPVVRRPQRRQGSASLRSPEMNRSSAVPVAAGAARHRHLARARSNHPRDRPTRGTRPQGSVASCAATRCATTAAATTPDLALPTGRLNRSGMIVGPAIHQTMAGLCFLAVGWRRVRRRALRGLAGRRGV
jgi:hypothetical protein